MGLSLRLHACPRLQGRGPATQAYTHALEGGHHMFMKVENGKVRRCGPSGRQGRRSCQSQQLSERLMLGFAVMGVLRLVSLPGSQRLRPVSQPAIGGVLQVYCLPDMYEVTDRSLADIQYVLNPTFTGE